MFIRNLGYDPSTKAIRASRPWRYTGVVLPNGVGLPRSSSRGLQITLEDAANWIDFLIEQVRECRIEVSDDSGQVLAVEDLTKLAGIKPDKPAEPTPEVKTVATDKPAEPAKKLDEKPAEPVRPAKKVKHHSEDELQAMKRSELDNLAKKLGLEPADYHNKAGLIEAIINAEG